MAGVGEKRGRDDPEGNFLGPPAIPNPGAGPSRSIKDPTKMTPAMEAELAGARSRAISSLYAENPRPSPEEIRSAIETAEANFYRDHLTSRFGGRRRRTHRKVRIPIKKNGDLTNLGYSLSKKPRSRHSSLKRAVKKFGRATVSRKLNALAVLNKRRHPATARKARADRKYAMTQ